MDSPSIAPSPQLHADYVKSTIERLRKDLLDFSAKNRLLRTNLDEKKDFLRIINTHPETLLATLKNDEMVIKGLPGFDMEPLDENTAEFRNQFDTMLSVDTELQEALKQYKNPDHFDLRLLKRKIKDKLRNKLGMPKRDIGLDASESERKAYAQIFGIEPDYSLSNNPPLKPSCLQTLLFEHKLHKKLNKIISKNRDEEQEKGITILHMAFGFLQWQDPEDNKIYLSPLLLLPIQIQKNKTRNGIEYRVEAIEDDCIANATLFEKLRSEHSVLLPELDENSSLPGYFDAISSLAPKNFQRWMVLPEVAIGNFPTSKMAMYKDLENINFTNLAPASPLLQIFSAGGCKLRQAESNQEYEEYTVNNGIEPPLTVYDADSSQYQVIMDTVLGKNIAVEGPPGTGKSQTIVNTIAAAVASGKKVLFVAEKTAALEVVRTRLEALGIGDFLLALQTSKSCKLKLLDSLRNRIELLENEPCAKQSAQYQKTLKDYCTYRDRQNSYVNSLHKEYKKSGKRIYDFIGEAVRYKEYYRKLPECLLAQSGKVVESDFSGLAGAIRACEEIAEIAKRNPAVKTYWKAANLDNLSSFAAKDLLDLAQTCGKTWKKANTEALNLTAWGMTGNEHPEDIKLLAEAVKYSDKELEAEHAATCENLHLITGTDGFFNFLSRLSVLQKNTTALRNYCRDPLDTADLQRITELVASLKEIQINDISDIGLDKAWTRLDSLCTHLRGLFQALEKAQYSCGIQDITLWHVFSISKILENTDSVILNMRDEKLQDKDIRGHLLQVSIEAIKLKKEHEEKYSHISLDDLPAPDVVARCHNSLLEENLKNKIADIFNKKITNAKLDYLKISATSEYNKDIAISFLAGLHKWLEQATTIQIPHQIAEFVDNNPIMLIKQCEAFVILCRFYELTEESLTGFSNRKYKDFLYQEESEKLLEWPTQGMPEGINDLGLGVAEVKLLADRTDANKEHLKNIDQDIRFINKEILKFKVTETSVLEAHKDKIETLLSLRDEVEAEPVYNAVRPYVTDWQINENDVSLLAYGLTLLCKIDPKHKHAAVKAMKEKTFLQFSKTVREVSQLYDQAISLTQTLCAKADINTNEWFHEISHLSMGKHLEEAAADKEGLKYHSDIAQKSREMPDSYSTAFLEHAKTQANYMLTELDMYFKAYTANQLLRDAVDSGYGEHILALSDHCSPAKNHQEIRDKDRHLINLSKDELYYLLLQNFDRNALYGISKGRKSDYTNLPLIQWELNKKKRHLPIRQLTQRAGKALLELKPCWMMSPLAVSYYICRNNIMFDLVIIDEASQMPVADALIPLLRAKQVMIVGDTNQLPPTRFGQSNQEDSDDDENEPTEESILEKANIAFAPKRQLKWHYRSRHSGLIQFCNMHVYDNKLQIFPAPDEGTDIPTSYKGVELKTVAGLYRKGQNPIEAEEIVIWVLDFMEKQIAALRKGDQMLSIGVVTINAPQRDLLYELFEARIDNTPIAAEYVAYWSDHQQGMEEFFVKNLENVQGDERDVIVIGTVYGPETHGGTVAQRFGDINKQNAKRRLNVLFSRAKHHMITFTSLTPDQISADESKPGPYMLKKWLEYSKTSLLENAAKSNREPDSEFEEFVIEAINALGFEAVPQVGVSGYRIDIGVKHPLWQYGYILGIECDGASYHSSKSARERDRLRQENLEKMGWHIYRIWSTHWFNDREKEIEKLKLILEQRLKSLTGSDVFKQSA